MSTVTLEQYWNRLEIDTRLLREHPEHKDLLERRIKEHKEMIRELGGQVN